MSSQPFAATPRSEAGRLLAGRGVYTADLRLPRMLHAAFVRSPYAHAAIADMSLDRARAAPGVVAVYRAQDLAAVCRPMHTRLAHLPAHHSVAQPPLAADRALWQGEPVVAVVAASRAEAEDALAEVDIDWRPLPALVGAEALSDETPLHPGRDDNCALRFSLGESRPADDPPRAADEVTRELCFGRQTGVPLEPRSLLAAYEPGDDSLLVYQSHQAPHLLKSLYAALLGLQEQNVRVICRDVGGGFGTKLHLYGDELAVVAIARLLGRPVAYSADRLEAFVSDAHAREFRVRANLRLNAAGAPAHFDLHLRGSLGAYSIYPRSGIGEGMQALGMSGAPYRDVGLSGTLELYYRNQTPSGAYRGVGQPLACAITELLIDDAAASLGVDPVAYRRAHYLGADELPRRSAGGLELPLLSLRRCLDRLCELMDYPRLRERQREHGRRDDTRLRGIGVATFIEQTALGAALYGPSGQPLSARDSCHIRLEPDGGVRCAVGCTDQGQGTLSGIRQIVAGELGVALERVRVSAGDSDGPYGGGAWASRGLAISGEAARRAAVSLRERILTLAGAALQIAPARLSLSDGAVASDGQARLALDELARLAYFRQHLLPPDSDTALEAGASFLPEDPPYYIANGVQGCWLEVDTDSGSITLRRHWVVEDCGRVVDPKLVDEQIRGGVVQGLGAALFEHCRYDAEGQLLNGSLADYLVPMAAEMPDIEVAHIETPADTALGVKGAGEAGVIGATAAVWCALNDALRPLGARVDRQPFTPEVVLQALARREGRADKTDEL